MSRRSCATIATTAASRVQALIIDHLATACVRLVRRGVAADRIDQLELRATGLDVAHAITVDGVSVYEISVEAVVRDTGTYDFLRLGGWRLDGLARVGLPIDVAALEQQRSADAS